MERTFIACEDCGDVQIGRVDATGTIALSTESKECATCGGTSFRIHEGSADNG